ncbi:D-2-hydroxyacid dehydrogenase [Paenirhodobacter sp.]|uniref:D-2-hydroxyacid dehydrogenase n=1 Tax=Paenirhodobacter sp. TaxID=1965326 RepID=UPI003B410C06
MTSLLPPDSTLRLCFAHPTFDMKPMFDALGTGIETIQVRTSDALRASLPTVDVLVASMLWSNDMLPVAGRLRYLQSFSAGLNQFDLDAFRARGVLLAGASGVNRNAVSEHVFALLLSLTRQLGAAHDNQRRHLWQPQRQSREEEIAGKTMLVIGLGAIGDRVARLAKAFDMTVIGVRRDPAQGRGQADEVFGFTDLAAAIPRADVVVLCCPLTEETRGLLSRPLIAALNPGAYVVNVARGACVDQGALTEALAAGRIAGAALDVTDPEPLPPDSPLWDMPNVVISPHVAGETRFYEQNVIGILCENLARLKAGRADLLNRGA